MDIMDIERRQLTRAEKHEFFLAFRDKTEDEVIQFMKDNPWAFSSIFWFETVDQINLNGERRDGCSCSKDYELGMKTNVTTEEILTRLQLCIRYGMCFHVILQKSGVPVMYDQDISTDQISEYCNGIEETNPTRNLNKCTAGIYWIHLAILFGKEKIIRDLLTIYQWLSLPTDFLVSLKHKISPILLAVLHKRSSIAKCIGAMYPSLICHQSIDMDALNTNYASKKEDTQINALIGAMSVHQYEDFNMLWALIKEPTRETNMAISSLWLKEMEHAVNTGNEEHMSGLTKIKGMSLANYCSVFGYIDKSGCSIGYKIILGEFCQQFMSTKSVDKKKKVYNEQERTKAKKVYNEQERTKATLDKIMTRVIFLGDASVVQLFVDHGFNVNAKFCEQSMLSWTEILNVPEISKVLTSAGAIKTEHDTTKPLVQLVLDQTNYSSFDVTEQFTDIDSLFIIHKLFENGLGCVSNNIIDKAFDKYQYLLVKYLLLRGADPHPAFSYTLWIFKLLYLIVVTNTPYTNFQDFIEENGSFHSLYTLFDVLRVLPDIVNKSAIQDMVSTETMEWMKSELIPKAPTYLPWYSGVRSLKSMCRSRLCSHFEGFKYLRYLKKIEESVPTSIFIYLKKDDILQKFLAASQQREFDRLFAGVDTYFL